MTLSQASAEWLKKYEGFAKNAYWDVNAYRIGYGSDTITLDNGTIRKVAKGDTTNIANATKNLMHRLENEFIPTVIKQIGEEDFNRLPQTAQVSLISFAYNYGSISKPKIIDAARSGDVNKLSFEIVDSTKNDNLKLNSNVRNVLVNRRKDEANLAKSILNKVEAKVEDVVKSTKEFTTKTQQTISNNKEAILIGMALVTVSATLGMYLYLKFKTAK